MRIGVPTERLNNENRVALTPSGVYTLTQAGHEVYIQKGAGMGSNFPDEEYVEAGGVIVDTAEEAWAAEMVMKVKEPLEEEYQYLREDLILFTYFHLAQQEELTGMLLEKKVASVAYETVQLDDRSLPLLAPMSEVAGRMATQIGSQFLEKTKGGKGILLSGVTGVERGKVTIIGGGQAGANAARVAVGLGADVVVIDLSLPRLRELDEIFGNSIQTLVSNPFNIEHSVKDSDLVVGAVLIPGARAPKLVSEEMVKSMQPGSVLVDIAIDQGGIFETNSTPTTHDDPVFEKYGVLHYAVPNMPGAVPRTATMALTNVTVPYALRIANEGLEAACLADEALLKGLNTYKGHVTYAAVAEAQNRPYKDPKQLM